MRMWLFRSVAYMACAVGFAYQACDAVGLLLAAAMGALALAEAAHGGRP